MDNTFISLLYPDDNLRQKHALKEKGYLPDISEAVCKELGLTEILCLRNSSIVDYFTCLPEVIRYRQDAFDDLIRLPEIGETLNRALPILFDIRELRQLDGGAAEAGEAYLYSITEIELYVSCIRALAEGLSPIREQVRSAAFKRLCEVVLSLSESDYYKELNERLAKLSSHVHEIKSITVGVNLDAQLRPCEAGVISLNAEPFKSGKLLDKILRMSFRNDAMTCIASLVPFGKGQSENRREALIGAFNSAIEEVFRSSVHQWRAIAGEYVLENTDFLLRILPEIEFMTRGADLLRRLRDKGLPTAIPRILGMEQKAFAAKGLYNPRVALAISEDIVANDFAFDERARIYVLTGPNRGGKSVITCAVGLAQAMAQLGLQLPSLEVEISPVDGIFTHFPQGDDDTIEKGRLGEECARLKEIFDRVSADSMILLDESLSSTGAYEAAFIASEILSAFGVRRCRGIFSTHLHELAAGAEDIHRRSVERGGVPIDTLVAGIEEGRRSFRIHRMRPDGKSYARDIAVKYGLTFENLMGDA